MPFTPFKKGTNSHSTSGAKAKGSPKPTPAGPSGKFDPNDSPGKDENMDGVYGKPVKSVKPAGKSALAGLKAAKPF